MMASLGGDVKSLSLSHPSFTSQNHRGREITQTTVRKGWGKFPGGRAKGGGRGLQLAHK